MSLRLQIIVGVIIIIAIFMIANMVLKKKLDLRYALIWLLAGVVVLILDIFPSLLNWGAKLLGIGLPVNMLFFLGFIFSLVIIFSLTLSLSKLSHKVKCLTQELALLEKELKYTKEDRR